MLYSATIASEERRACRGADSLFAISIANERMHLILIYSTRQLVLQHATEINFILVLKSLRLSILINMMISDKKTSAFDKFFAHTVCVTPTFREHFAKTVLTNMAANMTDFVSLIEEKNSLQR